MSVRVFLLALVAVEVFLLPLRAQKQGEDVPTENSFRIPISTTGSESGAIESLFCGVPFPNGWKIAPVAVVDEAGNAVPSSSRVMARWPESESVRWLGVEFFGQPSQKYFVVPAKEQNRSFSKSLEVSEEGDAFVVKTGPAKYVLPKRGALIAQAFLDRNADGKFDADECLIENTKGDDLFAVDQNGVLATVGADAEEGQLTYET
ncbi:MAG: hypothetical protein ACK5LK_04920, partial [Chthoniobacterales bacterium]